MSWSMYIDGRYEKRNSRFGVSITAGTNNFKLKYD